MLDLLDILLDSSWVIEALVWVVRSIASLFSPPAARR
jgi:hypothetical protein